MPLSNPDQCLGHAEQCERLAATATDPQIRDLWLWLAKRWRARADDVEQVRDLELRIQM